MNKKYYITTPIYYPSADFHIGHCYTTIIADAIARYKRLNGYDVFFQTGTDEHGAKIEQKAKDAGVTPKEYVDVIIENAKNLWKSLNISYDYFIRTTDENHVKAVQKIFRKLYDQGDIYKGSYEGLYCVPCESFWTETQLVDGKCPDCGREVKTVTEEAYFFKLSKYQDKLIELYDKNPEFILPVSRKNELVNNFIKPGLEDLCISRTTFNWGIPVPNDPKHVMYVWLDALLNYVTALGYLSDDESLLNKFWPADVQIIGKDILRFHAIYWPIFLMALNLPTPKKLFVHDFIMMRDGKMSKSKGNTIYPDILADAYGVDAVRYTILKSLPYGQDGEFTPESFIEKYNTDLCNDLGNLVNRTVAMINKYQDGIIKLPKIKTQFDDELNNFINTEIELYEKEMENINIQNAISHILNIVSRTNKYIDETSPWVLYKEEKMDELESVMYNLYEAIRRAAILFVPFIPETSEKIFNQMGLKENQTTYNTLKEINLENNKVIEKGIPLFERLDANVETDRLVELMKTC